MEIDIIRSKLHEYVDSNDSKLLRLMYALAKEYKEENEGDVSNEFSESDIARYEARRNKRLNGESETYSWAEAKKKIKDQ